jgi:hypothetical protein
MTLEIKTFLNRKRAGQHLLENYGFGSENTLAKIACLGGGPLFRKAGRRVLYKIEDLDQWAQEKISLPIKSTSELNQLINHTNNATD